MTTMILVSLAVVLHTAWKTREFVEWSRQFEREREFSL